jgi:Dolichyl-phosphate-mannose-protein mannosyltransferase
MSLFRRRTIQPSSLFQKESLVIVLMFVTAFGLRLVYINQPPLDFHAVRQYNALLVARDYYYDSIGSIPSWKRDLATLNRERLGTWEPPILPASAAIGYRIVGGEHFWVPRLLSSLSWLVGAAFMYLIAKRLARPHPGAALVSTAVFLFLPFGVDASRSVQPDSMMIAGLLASIYVILRYFENPSQLTLLAGAAVIAFAIVIKGVSVFMIIPSFVFVGLSNPATRQVFFKKRTLLLTVGALLPAALFYFYMVFLSGSLGGVARGDILPQLWWSPSFWSGWVEETQNVVGYSLVVGALLGTLLFRAGIPRNLILGLWTGYIAFGLVFTYTISTHDYWNLPIVPIVALGLGPPIALVIESVRHMNRRRLSQGALGVILLGAILLAAWVARPRPLDPSLKRRAEAAEGIGALVNHTRRAVFLSGDYGLPLEYHGQLSGVPWPLASDLEWEDLAGVRHKSVEERFASLLDKEAEAFDYFIILDYSEFEQQPALRKFLRERFPIRAQTDDYLIFDLRLGRASAARAAG